MHFDRMKRFLLLTIAMLLAFNVFAASYVITDYEILVDGKTQKRVIRNLIIPEDTEEVFASEEELVAALDGKRQALVNKRVFKSVSYEYTLSEEEEGKIGAAVTYNIVDAKTFLAVTYPKYDTNTGLTINAKIKDKNLIGTFASLDGDVYALFEDGVWNNPKLSGEFKITDLLIGDTVFSFNLKGSGYLKNLDPSYSASTSIRKIPFLFGSYFDLAASIEKSGEGHLLKPSLSYSGVKLLGITFAPSVSGEYYTKSPEKTFFTPALSISGINLWGTTLSFSGSTKFMGTKESKYKTFQPIYYEATGNVDFGWSLLEKFSLTSTLGYTPETKIESKSKLSYTASSATTFFLIENVTMDDKGNVSSFDTGLGISQSATIANHFSITPTFTEYIRTTINDGEPEFSRYYTISASTSRDLINWQGNFRDGFALSFSINESWGQDTFGIRTLKDGFYTHFSFTYFKLLWNWFNPSFRVIANYRSGSVGDFVLHNSSSNIGEFMRGIRNDTVEKDNLFALVANLNILTLFPMPKLFSFADYYASAFFDFGMVQKNSESELERYYSCGVEGVGIFKDYPSYPIRLSIGVDLKRLSEWLEDERSADFYEIYFGLDFFF